jgi:hypothetical protein
LLIEDDDEEIDESLEPTTWDDVADTIEVEEKQVDDILVLGHSEAGNQNESLIVDDMRDKFRDPLGVLRVPPRGIKKIPNVEEEGFDPAHLLSLVHGQTKYEDLVAGAKRLTRKLSSQEEDIKQLVRDNFDRFISCKDVIDNLYSLITENEASTSETGTGKMEETYAEIIRRAKNVYGPLLSRKTEAERIRQALSVLSRFAFLFALPSKIAANIKAGEYDKAVQHYKKVCNLHPLLLFLSLILSLLPPTSFSLGVHKVTNHTYHDDATNNN